MVFNWFKGLFCVFLGFGVTTAVNFAHVEDYGAPELVVEVDGCTIPKVPVDGGSGVNLMLESTAFDLGYTTFEETNQIL